MQASAELAPEASADVLPVSVSAASAKAFQPVVLDLGSDGAPGSADAPKPSEVLRAGAAALKAAGQEVLQAVGEDADAEPPKGAAVLKETGEEVLKAGADALKATGADVELAKGVERLEETGKEVLKAGADALKAAEADVEAVFPPQPEELATGADVFKAAGEKAVAEVLDIVAEVKVDADTEDEFWNLDVPFFGNQQILRKRTSDSEVALVGLFAGGAVELGRVLLLHPIDTVKTRLQVPGAGLSALRPERLLDGLGPAIATVPLCALFWAVKDVVRRRIVGLIPLPFWHDVLSTTIAAAVGEMAYWAARTPSELLKTRAQAELVEEEEEEQEQEQEKEKEEAEEEAAAAAAPAGAARQPAAAARAAPAPSSGGAAAAGGAASEPATAKEEAAAAAAGEAAAPGAQEAGARGAAGRAPRKSAEEDEDPLWLQSLNSFPVLALSDVPNVTLRTTFFVLLHSAPGAPEGIGADALLFAVASTGAALFSTPLDVARTRLLLSGHGVEELPETILKIGREEGLSGLMAGWLPRTLWNGVAVGAAIGLVRQGYTEVRAAFLLDVLDQLENLASPLLA